MRARSESETVALGDEVCSSVRKTFRQADFPFLVKDSKDKDRDLGRKKQEIQRIHARDVAAIATGCVFGVGNARRGNPT